MVWTISRDEPKAALDRADRPVLVEALPAKYYEDAHLPGAINIPHDPSGRSGAAAPSG